LGNELVASKGQQKKYGEALLEFIAHVLHTLYGSIMCIELGTNGLNRSALNVHRKNETFEILKI